MAKYALRPHTAAAVHHCLEQESTINFLKKGSDKGSKFLPPLPLETVLRIISYIPLLCHEKTQPVLSACCLLSKVWYAAAIKSLYNTPHLFDSHFSRFVRTICPPVHVHVGDKGLVRLITRLDMGALADPGSKGLALKLLGRVEDTLEIFVAPRTPFS